MVQCGRCGLPFPSASAQPTELSPASQRELGGPPVAQGPRRRSSMLPLMVLLALLAVAVFAASAISRRVQQLLPDGSIFAGPSSPDGGMRDPTAGVFQERPSATETPTVILSGTGTGTLTLALRGEDGQVYTVQSHPGERNRIQLPAGQYTITITSSLPGVPPNQGDATFRRFKEYEAYFELDVDAPPIHLGD